MFSCAVRPRFDRALTLGEPPRAPIRARYARRSVVLRSARRAPPSTRSAYRRITCASDSASSLANRLARCVSTVRGDERQRAPDLLVGEPGDDQRRAPRARARRGARSARARARSARCRSRERTCARTAFCSASSSRSSSTGFSRNSAAPALNARRHRSTVPWPVSMITGWSTPLRDQRVEHREAADAGHAHVEHDRADRFAVEAGEEGLRVRPGLHAQPHGADQPRERVAHRRVVVDEVDQRRGRHALDRHGGRRGFIGLPRSAAAPAGTRRRADRRWCRRACPHASGERLAQAQAQPQAARARREERLEDTRQRLGGNPGTAVRDRQHPAVAVDGGGESEASLRRRAPLPAPAARW